MLILNNKKIRIKFGSWDIHTPTHFFLHNGKIIGSFMLLEEGYWGELWCVVIRNKYRGKGYGRIMMSEIIETFKNDLYLFVRDENVVAKNLYKALGFKVSGRHPYENADEMFLCNRTKREV